MDTSKMAYPWGRCASCGKEFNSELRNEYEITYCPWCGQLILDYFHDINPPPGLLVKPDMDRYYYCEDCGTRIYERSGKGGRWLNEGEKVPGVCSGPCERELCGNCGDWDGEGCCPKCNEEKPEHKDEIKTGWWKVNFELTLDGKDVRFEDLSEVSQDHIIQCIRDGCNQGRLVEEIDEQEEETDKDEEKPNYADNW